MQQPSVTRVQTDRQCGLPAGYSWAEFVNGNVHQAVFIVIVQDRVAGLSLYRGRRHGIDAGQAVSSKSLLQHFERIDPAMWTC